MFRMTLQVWCVLMIGICSCYQDDFPDPDFLPEYTKDSVHIVPSPAKEQCETKIPGYFIFLVKEILKLNILSEEEKVTFSNIQEADPISVCEIMLKNLEASKLKMKSTTSFINDDLSDLIPERKNIILHIGIIYIIVNFIACYFSNKARTFIFSFHCLALYLSAVYFRALKQFTEGQANKLAAFDNVPAHCKDTYSFEKALSWSWSRMQIGDSCKTYHKAMLTDPLYDIDLAKCSVYPLVAVFSVPLTVLGEELGPFLENVLTPFPIYLQVFILVFVTISFGGLTTMVHSLTRCAPQVAQPLASVTKAETLSLQSEMMKELREIKMELALVRREETDILQISNSDYRNVGSIEREANYLSVGTIEKEEFVSVTEHDHNEE